MSLARQWQANGSVPSGATAYAVTDDVVNAVEGDEEEQEFAVTVLAADESLVLLADDDSAPSRRVVLVAEAAAEVGEGAQVLLRADIDLAHLDAVLIDDAANIASVERAVADAAPEALDDVELLWFSPDELSDLLG